MLGEFVYGDISRTDFRIVFQNHVDERSVGEELVGGDTCAL